MKDIISKYRSLTIRSKKTKFLIKFISWLALLAGSIAFLSPLYIMVVLAFKDQYEIASFPAWSLPAQWSLDNFIIVLNNPIVNFWIFFKNSSIIAVLATVGTVLSSSLVAYPFARLKFRGKDKLFALLLSTMMLPAIVTLIPTYVMYKHLYWVNTFYPLIVPAFFGNAFGIFLIRQFFMSIPKEFEEAAMLDGASHWTIYWKLMMPLSRPALATLGVFTFVYHWRDFMGPLIYLNDIDKQTLELGLSSYQVFHSEQWHLLMAGSVLVMLPLIFIFLVGQKYLTKGIVAGGIK